MVMNLDKEYSKPPSYHLRCFNIINSSSSLNYYLKYLVAFPVVTNAIVHFALAFLILGANLTVSVALSFMKRTKKATRVFLGQLAFSNLLQGVIFFWRGVFFIWPVSTTGCCLTMQLFNTASTGSYMTGIFYVYLDLYLSMKKMSVSRPVISARLAVIMASGSWIV